MFQSFQEDQEEGSRTPEKLFLEHLTAEPVRDEVLEETTSQQEVIMKPAIYPQEGFLSHNDSHRSPEEERWDLEIIEDNLISGDL